MKQAVEHSPEEKSGQFQIHYRELNHADSAEYRRIRLECLQKYPDFFGSTFDEEFHAASVRLAQVPKENSKNSFVCGAFNAEERLVGICGFTAEQRLKTQHRGEIQQLFVDPLYLRQGIGKKLLTLSIQKAFNTTQIEQIILGIVSTNEIAIQLYKLFGFIEYGRLANYFKTGGSYFTQVFFVLHKSKQKQVF